MVHNWVERLASLLVASMVAQSANEWVMNLAHLMVECLELNWVGQSVAMMVAWMVDN
jgi:hypothetical protein